MAPGAADAQPAVVRRVEVQLTAPEKAWPAAPRRAAALERSLAAQPGRTAASGRSLAAQAGLRLQWVLPIAGLPEQDSAPGTARRAARHSQEREAGNGRRC
jgi:hypothetical protein